MNYKELARLARKAQKNSYAPYSKFRVGAALMTDDEEVFTGCNIENSSFSLTICAERTALFKAISENKQTFKAIAITSDAKGFTPPCGACLQVMWDLAGNIDVILTNAKGTAKVMKLSKFLPHPFDNTQLSKK